MFHNTEYVSGIFHLHSNFSHDGKSNLCEIADKLKVNGFKFCIITDHFEDFDEETFLKYISKIKKINEKHEVLFVPGIEIEFLNYHIILFPVSDYNEICELIFNKNRRSNNLIKIVAHPARNGCQSLKNLMNKFKFDGIEIWNQRADGNYSPPIKFIYSLKKTNPIIIQKVFFGVDLHVLNLQINNVIYIKVENEVNINFIVEKLRSGNFINYNKKANLFLRGKVHADELLNNVLNINKKAYLYGIFLNVIKEILRVFYRMLPGNIRKKTNSLKDAIKGQL